MTNEGRSSSACNGLRRHHRLCELIPSIPASRDSSDSSPTGIDEMDPLCSLKKFDTGVDSQSELQCIRMTVQVMLVGAPKCGKTSLLKNLELGFGIIRSESETLPLVSREERHDHVFNIIDLSLDDNLQVSRLYSFSLWKFLV